MEIQKNPKQIADNASVSDYLFVYFLIFLKIHADSDI